MNLVGILERFPKCDEGARDTTFAALEILIQNRMIKILVTFVQMIEIERLMMLGNHKSRDR